MLDNRRVKPLGDDVSKEQAEMFLFDVFNRSTVEEAKHKVLLRKGLVWYLPHGDGKGIVSTPFSYLMQLMSKAGGVFADVANQLDPKKEKYEPRKAMEYVAALGFLLRHVGSVRDWIGTDLYVREGRGQAFRNIRSSVHDTFMSIWPAANGPATDFCGKGES